MQAPNGLRLVPAYVTESRGSGVSKATRPLEGAARTLSTSSTPPDIRNERLPATQRPFFTQTTLLRLSRKRRWIFKPRESNGTIFRLKRKNASWLHNEAQPRNCGASKVPSQIRSSYNRMFYRPLDRCVSPDSVQVSCCLGLIVLVVLVTICG